MKLFELKEVKKKKPSNEGLFDGSATAIAKRLQAEYESTKEAMSALNAYAKELGKDLSDTQKAKIAHIKSLLNTKTEKEPEEKEEPKEKKEEKSVKESQSMPIKLPADVYQASLGKDPKKWSDWYTKNGFTVDKKTNHLAKDGSNWKIDSASKSLKPY